MSFKENACGKLWVKLGYVEKKEEESSSSSMNEKPCNLKIFCVTKKFFPLAPKAFRILRLFYQEQVLPHLLRIRSHYVRQLRCSYVYICLPLLHAFI